MLAFHDRGEAGRALARLLGAYGGREDVTVLALPRGGVPVAAEVARALDAPLDVFAVRKLGLPGHEEYAMGAIAGGGVRVLDAELIRRLAIGDELVEAVVRREARELERRERAYRDHREPAPIEGRTVLLVDDGLATGATMYAAVLALRQRKPAGIVVAAPVASWQAVELLRGVADEVVCAAIPEPFYGVGNWYEAFEQLTDADVRAGLAEASARSAV